MVAGSKALYRGILFSDFLGRAGLDIQSFYHSALIRHKGTVNPL